MKLTTINAIPAPSLSRFGFRSPSQRTSGGHKIRASLSASRQASTPERNMPAIATRRFFSGVIARQPASGLCGDSRHRLSAGRSPTMLFGHPSRAWLDGQQRAAVPTYFFLERVDARDALPDDQRVHVVRSLVGLH